MQSYYLIIIVVHIRNFCNQMTNHTACEMLIAYIELARKRDFDGVCVCVTFRIAYELALHQHTTLRFDIFFFVHFFLFCPLILYFEYKFQFHSPLFHYSLNLFVLFSLSVSLSLFSMHQHFIGLFEFFLQFSVCKNKKQMLFFL